MLTIHPGLPGVDAQMQLTPTVTITTHHFPSQMFPWLDDNIL